jgi:hypothetical protein
VYSDREILRHKQSQFSGAVWSFWQEAKSYTLENSTAAVVALKKAVRTKPSCILNPFVEAVGGVEVLKTQIGCNFVRNEEVLSNYCVMQTLQRWRQHDRTAFDDFIQKLSSRFMPRNRQQDAGQRSRRNFKLEAQCIASIELAQSFMQSTCLKMYRASFSVLQSQLGPGVVGTIQRVETGVREYLLKIQSDFNAGEYAQVFQKHPGFACPVDTENNMRVAAESTGRLDRIVAQFTQ